MAKTNHGHARRRVKLSCAGESGARGGIREIEGEGEAAGDGGDREARPAYEYQLVRGRQVAVEGPVIDSPEACYRYWREVICGEGWYCGAKEQLVVLLLNTRVRLEGHHVVAVGTAYGILASPREVLAPVLRGGLPGFVLMHNHPSGDPSPSIEDEELTEQIAEAARIVGVQLHDHIIAGLPGFGGVDEPGYSSFREEELL